MHRPIPAVFMRGGTSKAIMFHARDLPTDRAAWDAIFSAAMGSPDPYGRQLDGMGGGISSLSKVCVLAPSKRDDADIDYTFAQVQIKDRAVDYKGNCGNMSSAVGPFAVDEGLECARRIVLPNGSTAVRWTGLGAFVLESVSEVDHADGLSCRRLASHPANHPITNP
jgi:2-methylaconitate isomerase